MSIYFNLTYVSNSKTNEQIIHELLKYRFRLLDLKLRTNQILGSNWDYMSLIHHIYNKIHYFSLPDRDVSKTEKAKDDYINKVATFTFFSQTVLR